MIYYRLVKRLAYFQFSTRLNIYIYILINSFLEFFEEGATWWRQLFYFLLLQTIYSCSPALFSVQGVRMSIRSILCRVSRSSTVNKLASSQKNAFFVFSYTPMRKCLQCFHRKITSHANIQSSVASFCFVGAAGCGFSWVRAWSYISLSLADFRAFVCELLCWNILRFLKRSMMWTILGVWLNTLGYFFFYSFY